MLIADSVRRIMAPDRATAMFLLVLKWKGFLVWPKLELETFIFLRFPQPLARTGGKQRLMALMVLLEMKSLGNGPFPGIQKRDVKTKPRSVYAENERGPAHESPHGMNGKKLCRERHPVVLQLTCSS